MPANDFLSIFIVPLHRTGVPYMITGSVAAMMYGEPRMTNDIDVVIELQEYQIDRLLKVYPAEDYYRPPIEVFGIELKRAQRGHLNVIHHLTGFKADFYLLGNDPLHVWGMKNKRIIHIGNDGISLAPPEYVILRKLEYYREGGFQKHLIDIKAMLRVSSDISLDIINDWVGRLSLQKEWSTLLEK